MDAVERRDDFCMLNLLVVRLLCLRKLPASLEDRSLFSYLQFPSIIEGTWKFVSTRSSSGSFNRLASISKSFKSLFSFTRQMLIPRMISKQANSTIKNMGSDKRVSSVAEPGSGDALVLLLSSEASIGEGASVGLLEGTQSIIKVGESEGALVDEHEERQMICSEGHSLLRSSGYH